MRFLFTALACLINVSVYGQKVVHNCTNNKPLDSFTSNGVWNISFINQYEPISIEIFDRWGNLVWGQEAPNISNWMGASSNGNPLGQGVYYYVINCKKGSETGTIYLTRTGRSQNIRIEENVKKEKPMDSKPPILSISNIEFIDGNGNNTIDALEENSLTFSLNNTGPGYGSSLKAEVSISGNFQGIDCKQVHTLETVESGSSRNYTIPISSTRFTTDGSIKINVEVIEPQGFSPKPFTLEIDTRAFRAPKLEVVDFSSSMPTWKPNTPIELDVLIQNTGDGTAENLEIEMNLPNSVNCYSNNTSINISSLAPGESNSITYDMIVPRNFAQNTVTAKLTLSEKFGDYGSTWNNNFPLEGVNNSANVISIESADGNDAVEIYRASLNKSNTNENIRIRTSEKLKDISKLAVIGKESTLCDGSEDDGQELAELVEGELLGIYGVVERKHLEEILDEQRLAMSGLLLEDSDFAQAGCLAGAQGTVLASYGCLQGQTKIQIKLVDCSTSDLYWSATGLDVSAFDLMDALRIELSK